MDIRFDGKTVVVAGAARGIGRAIARAFAADGASVLACDRLVGEIEPSDRIKALAVDVTDPSSIDAVVAQAGGTIDVLVYVAGGIRGQKQKPLEDVSRRTSTRSWTPISPAASYSPAPSRPA